MLILSQDCTCVCGCEYECVVGLSVFLHVLVLCVCVLFVCIILVCT